MRLSRLVPALAAALPVFALSLGFGPSAAAAQSSAVVLEFEGGRDGAQARRAVVAGLEGAFPLVPLGDVEEAARTSGLDLTSPADAGRAAESAGAALVLSGAVTGRGRRARTTLVVRDVGGRDLAVREAGPPFGRPAQRALGEEALALVREAEMALAPSRSARGSEPGGNDDDAAPGAEGGTDDVNRVAGDTDADDDDDDDDDDDAHTPGAVPFFRALVGVDARTRGAGINTADGGARGYDAGLYPELMVALELRPFARLGGLASGLLVGLEGAHSVGLSSEIAGAGATLASASLRLAGQVGWLFATRDEVFAAGPVLGGGYDGFSLEANDVFASSGYAYARAGVAARVVLAGDALALGVGAGYRLTFGTGDLAAAFGTDGTAWGLDVRGELSGALGFGLSYAARVGYERYALAFEGGPGTLAEGRSGSDAALHLQLLVGWQIP